MLNRVSVSNPLLEHFSKTREFVVAAPRRAVGAGSGARGRLVGLAAGAVGIRAVPGLAGGAQLAAGGDLSRLRGVARPEGRPARPAAAGPEPPGLPRAEPHRTRRPGRGGPGTRLDAAVPGPASVRGRAGPLRGIPGERGRL